MEAPKAKKNPKKLEKHNDIRIDNYFWLNERENPEVLDYLNSELHYYQAETAHTKPLQDKLFAEMKARIKEDDSSVPYLYNGYWYYIRFEENKGYPIICRKKKSLEAAEQIMFDCNQLAENHAYYHLVGTVVTDDNKYCAFAVDTVSRREYTLQVKNLETGELLPDKIERTTGRSVWSADGSCLFYVRKDAETLRANKIYKHTLGTPVADDELIFEELDEQFSTYITRSKSRKYLVIGSESTLTSEYRILEANNPNGDFRIFEPRNRGVEYSISHYEDVFYIITNKDGAENFKLMKTPETHTQSAHWEEVVPHRKETLLEDLDVFKDYIVLSERTNGLNQIYIKPKNGEGYYLPFASETYTAYTTTNVDFDTDVLRFAYQSLNTPPSVMDFNMYTKAKKVLKVQPVLGGFSTHDYEEKRLWATAEDGTKVPISVIHKKGIEYNGENPLLLYAYGSYGHSLDAYFSTVRLSLLNRGFIYAIAHVRGGEDLGRAWYEQGKLLQKKNTFTDFIACSEYLIKENYTSSKHLYAMGGSAGGLLMGAIINMRPDLYQGVIAQVPFVDVVTTMLDDSIPLTTGEYDEWGNPNEKVYYEYMKSYSPYDNVTTQNYPNLLITTGFHDSQVQYWEPAKWIAKIRELRTNNNQLYLNINMDAGHGGASGRFEALKEVASEYAFILDLEGLKE